MGQVTVFSGVERRRRWSDDEKLALVEASLAPGASVTEIARRADLERSLLYRWRRELCGVIPRRPKGFAAVMVSPDVPISSVPEQPVMIIEIAGATVRVPNGTPAALLTAALRELSR